MRPLADVRILAVEQYGAGPFGSLHLADLGAEVIKIEDPGVGGDVGRYVPPFTQGEDSLFFETFNRNKRSISLDLSVPAGREVFEDLVRNSDAVYSNLRGDVPAKMGLTYSDLKRWNPAIVCCSLSGFGMTGPRSKEPGYDYILQGLAGWMSITGDPEGPPTKSGLSLVDFSGGLVAALSLMAGLHAAARDGIGGDCDVSLYDTSVSMLTYLATWHLNGGFAPVRTRNSAHPSLVPFQAFQASDGWIVAGCAKEKFWHRLVVAIDHPEWADSQEFATFTDRSKNSEKLLELLDRVFLEKSVKHWVELLTKAGVPVGPINDVAEALREPHTIARNLIVETEHPIFGKVKQVASPVQFGDDPKTYRRAPARNEDFSYVVRDILDLSEDRIEMLTARRAFGHQGDGAIANGSSDPQSEP